MYKNLIVCAFHKKTHTPILQNIFSKFKFTKCHLTYFNEKFQFSDISKIIYYKDFDLNNNATYPRIENLLPIDEDLTNKMQNCEIIVLKMMDRLNSLTKYKSYGYRKFIYLKHLRYWNHILIQDQINFVIFDNIPHQIYDFILFNLCKLYKIPTIVLFQLQIPDSTIFFEGYNFDPIFIKKRYLKLKNYYKNSSIDEIILTKNLNSYFLTHTDEKYDSTPFYMKKQEKIVIINGKIRNLKSFFMKINKRRTIINFLKNTRKEIKIKKIYNRNIETNPDLSKNYIYLALHYQPELTTSPLGGIYVEQYLIADMLNYCLPDNFYIYVKEHPKQKFNIKIPEIYNELIQIPKVKLIQRNFNSFELIEKSQAVATVTGTVGLEAIFKNKPVLLFGQIFYQYLDGVYPIKSIIDCKKALNKILKRSTLNYKKNIKIYLKAIEEFSINGYINNAYNVISMISQEENIKNLSKKIIYLIDKILSK